MSRSSVCATLERIDTLSALDFVFSFSSLGLCIVDQHFRFRAVNNAFCDLLRCSREWLLTKTILEVTHPEDRAMTRCRYTEFIRSQSPRFEFRKRWIRPDQSIVHGRVIAAANLSADDGSNALSIGIVEPETDVNCVRASESSDLVRLRAQSIAHDLGNVLQLIRSASESVRSERTYASSAAIIDDAVERASELCSSLFALGQPSDSATVSADVGAVVRRLHVIMDVVLPANILLRVNVPDTGSRVLLTETDLYRTLLNLVFNARDAMPNGGRIELDVSVDARSASIVVADTGEGISEKDLNAIWEPFFTTKHGSGGTGLGLSSSRALVESVGGSISVESKHQVGTTFLIRLPRIGQ